jgi:hypothetical protein
MKIKDTEMRDNLLIYISKMATPGSLQFSYDLYRRYHSLYHAFSSFLLSTAVQYLMIHLDSSIIAGILMTNLIFLASKLEVPILNKI